MAENRPENKQQHGQIDNLKKLAGVCNANNFSTLVNEIRKAKQVLDGIVEKVNSKLVEINANKKVAEPKPAEKVVPVALVQAKPSTSKIVFHLNDQQIIVIMADQTASLILPIDKMVDLIKMAEILVKTDHLIKNQQDNLVKNLLITNLILER